MLFLRSITIRCLALAIAWTLLALEAGHASEIATSGVAWEALAQDQGWLKLVHYEASRTSPTGWQSAIHSPGFFMDPQQGPTNPLAELKATLLALQRTDVTVPDEHPQCHLPARLLWLQQHLGSQITFPLASCPKWQSWSSGQHIQSVSLVLATGYLGNPASYYGHTLLKFNSAPGWRPTGLQDPAVSYGVINSKNDDPVTYIFKGMLGGYEGGFSDSAYYVHRHQYGENELRDLWEYELNLTDDEVRLVTAHAWEVIDQRYDYFFFRRNCAYRMAEIIQIMDDIDITPSVPPWVIPQATLIAAGQAKRKDGRPLIRSVRYQPSRQTRFYASYVALQTPQARAVFRQAVASPEVFSEPAFQTLPTRDKQAVIDAVMDYQQFVADPEVRTTLGTMNPVYVAALNARFALPAEPRQARETEPQPPDRGRAPGWIQAAWIHDAQQGSAALVRVRPAYYDALDSEPGHVPFSALSMADTSLRISRQQIHLERLDAVSVESSNPGISGLPGDRGQTWRFKVGAEPARPGCVDCLTLRLQGDAGLGKRLTPGLFMSVQAGGAVQNKRDQQGSLLTRVSSTVIMRPEQSNWDARVDVEQRWPVGGQDTASYTVTRGEWRYALGSEQDIRLMHEHSTGARGGSRVLLGWGRYW